jgi:hypothetical protein
MKIAVTGHRPERLKGQEAIIGQWLYDQLNKLQEQEEKITAAYNGMAMGADQIFALQCLKLNMPVYCVFPYKRKRYHQDELYIMKQAISLITLQDKYSQDCFYKRDCYMVDNCDILFAVWDGQPYGGTYDTIEYAKKQNKLIIYIPRELL